MKKFLLTIVSLFLFMSSVLAEEDKESNLLTPNAKSAILIEVETGEVLYEYNSPIKYVTN